MHDSETMTRPLAMWVPPRVGSTAFLRMISERGDFDTLCEPFMRPYYVGPARKSKRFNEQPELLGDEWTFDRVHADICAASAAANAAGRRLFFKDMAYYVTHLLTPRFITQYDTTVLVRHPAFVLLSLEKAMPDYTPEETGFTGLRDLFAFEMSVRGAAPPVLDAEDVMADPPGATRAYCAAVGVPFVERALRWEKGPCKAIEMPFFHEFFEAVTWSDGLMVRERRALPTLQEAMARDVDDLKGIYEEIVAHKLLPISS